MKIIGHAGTQYKRKILVEMEEDELANVMGHSYASSVPTQRAGHDRFEVGTFVDVGAAWNDLCRFRMAKSQIESAAQTLRHAAQIAETCGAVYATPPPEIPVPDKQPEL